MSFLQIYFNGELKFVAPLQSAITKIGRAADNDVVIDNAGVSGHHAAITRDGDSFYVEDFNSTNGVFLNGRRVAREQLSYGDEITIYKHKLKFTAVNLSTEAIGATATNPTAFSQNQTMEVDVSQLQAILQHQQSLVTYLQQTNGKDRGHKWVFKKQIIDIGKGKDCDIQIGGWFTPKLIARICRQSDGYYLYPEKKWVKIRLNGIPIDGPVKLQNIDKLQIRNVALTFYQNAAPFPSNA